MSWQQIDKWHMRNGDWTIDKAMNVPFPYGLWHGKESKGFFRTADEAKQRYEELKGAKA